MTFILAACEGSFARAGSTGGTYFPLAATVVCLCRIDFQPLCKRIAPNVNTSNRTAAISGWKTECQDKRSRAIDKTGHQRTHQCECKEAFAKDYDCNL